MKVSHTTIELIKLGKEKFQETTVHSQLEDFILTCKTCGSTFCTVTIKHYNKIVVICSNCGAKEQ